MFIVLKTVIYFTTFLKLFCYEIDVSCVTVFVLLSLHHVVTKTNIKHCDDVHVVMVRFIGWHPTII